MDIARPGSAYGSAPPQYFRKRVWSLTDRAYQDLNGCRCSSLNGYAMLGGNPVAEDIAAFGTVAQGVAQDIAAVNGPSYISPYGNYYTGLTPGGVAPPAAYPSSGSLVATLGGGSTPLVLIIAGLALAWALRK